jgi:GNAT superfamily N-acetyltransferase
VHIERVPPAVTQPLRRRVLRPGVPPERARLAADAHPEAAAFAATTPAGRVVGTAIVHPEPCPWLSRRTRAWRIRGMATDEAHRGQGIGRRVLDAVLAHVGAHGGDLVWCHARVPARGLYERAGFAAHGRAWDDPELGPHIAMWRDLP